MTILDLIESFFCKFNTLFYRKYRLKLDDYYYDYKRCIYIIVFRLRNKNAIIRISILDIIKNQDLINSLHPYDSYIIGTIKTMQENKYITNGRIIDRDYDDYYIIDPCIDWVGTDFTENKLIFKTKVSLTEKRIAIESFCRDLKLIRALSPASAFIIGSIVTNSFIQSAT